MRERRKYPRLDANVGVGYKHTKEEAPLTTTQSHNISAGGICLSSLDKFEVGDTLKLAFSLPGQGGEIGVLGKVKWVKELTVGDIDKSKAYDLGIEFVNIQEGDRYKIIDFVLNSLKK